jgi:hypothetical protein
MSEQVRTEHECCKEPYGHESNTDSLVIACKSFFQPKEKSYHLRLDVRLAHNHHLGLPTLVRSFLPALLDSLLTRVQRPLAFRLVGHFFSSFGI